MSVLCHCTLPKTDKALLSCHLHLSALQRERTTRGYKQDCVVEKLQALDVTKFNYIHLTILKGWLTRNLSCVHVKIHSSPVTWQLTAMRSLLLTVSEATLQWLIPFCVYLRAHFIDLLWNLSECHPSVTVCITPLKEGDKSRVFFLVSVTMCDVVIDLSHRVQINLTVTLVSCKFPSCSPFKC